MVTSGEADRERITSWNTMASAVQGFLGTTPEAPSPSKFSRTFSPADTHSKATPPTRLPLDEGVTHMFSTFQAEVNKPVCTHGFRHGLLLIF